MPNREGRGFRAPALSYAFKASERLPKNCYHLQRTRPEFEAGNVYFNRSITGALVGA